MLTSVQKLVVCKMCGELHFNQTHRDSRGKLDMVDRSFAGWVESCAFRRFGDYDRLLQIGKDRCRI